MNGVEFMSVVSEIVGNEAAHRYAAKFTPLDGPFSMGSLVNYEALAFYVYSTAVQWHADINRQLWSGRPTKAVQVFAGVLDGALSKLESLKGSQSTVYRGYHVDDVEVFRAEYDVGDDVIFRGFTSVAYHQQSAFGGNVLFIIRSLNARSIWFLASDFFEHEALMPTGCRFTVVSNVVQDGRLVLLLQEVVR